MKVLLSIWKWWYEFWSWDTDVYGSIDSHKWESKIEIYRGLSGN